MTFTSVLTRERWRANLLARIYFYLQAKKLILIAINDNFSLLRLPFRREVLRNGIHVCCHKLSYKPAKRVQAHSREALLPGYVPVMNDGPGRGVDTKHGVVTLLLEYKGRRKNNFNARTKTRRLRHCQVIWIHLQSLASILKKVQITTLAIASFIPFGLPT